MGRKRSARCSPWAVAAVVLLIYGGWVATALASGRDPRDFAITTRSTVQKCHASNVIQFDPRYHYNPSGYDGQFFYLIALDPIHAPCYLDRASYRYGRILYPITARLLGFSQPDWIPYTLIVTNLLALAGGTLAVGAWLNRKRISPWLALIYGFYPGLFVSLWRDLSEPLSYALVAVAIYLFEFGGRRRFLWSGLVFALAILARETAAIFAVVYGVILLANRNWRGAAELLATSVVPAALYRLFLRLWLGHVTEVAPSVVPFGGLAHWWPWGSEQIDITFSVVLPAMVCAGVALRYLERARREAVVWSLLANVLILVVLLAWQAYVEYYATGRATAGVPLAALFCLPVIDHLSRRDRSWLWASSVFWLAPWYFLVPMALPWANRGL